MGGGSLTSYVGWIGWMDLTAFRHHSDSSYSKHIG